VVDDIEMNITHVIRGDDHVNNTPRQMLLYEALGAGPPQFGHVPMILGADKARLSKRHGATSVMAYQEMGYLPEALVNYLVRLGWSHGDQEIFSLDELIRLFSLESVGKSAAVFNPEKLLWLNQHYIQEYQGDKLVENMIPFWLARGFEPSDRDYMRQVVENLRTRSKTLLEMADTSAFYFLDKVDYDPEAAKKFLTAEMKEHLLAVADKLLSYLDYSKSGLEAFLREVAENRGVKLKVIAQPLRVALTGKSVSPGIDDVMVTLGKDRVVRRIRQAVESMGG
jgi:glutamyl-tRNA synthetase